MTEMLHVGRPNIGDRSKFHQLVDEMFDRAWLTNDGPFVRELEQRIAQRIGVRNCVLTCNGTVALEITTRAVGLSGEVIVPAFSFVATAHALNWQGITPVFADIDPVTHNLDVASVESKITPRTTGIIGVHLWGRPAPIDELTDLARAHDLSLIFDAAHAFGSLYKGMPIGRFGRAEVFSFHATKFFNTFEGGAVTTDDDELAEKIRLMRNFGFAGFDNVIHSGTNGKMPEICAAMGLVNFDHIDDVVATNSRNYLHYRRAFEAIPHISLIEYDQEHPGNFQYIVAELDPQIARYRDPLVAHLNSAGVMARRYFWPGIHRMEPYRQIDPASRNLPVTEDIADRVVVLPTGTAVTLADLDRVLELIREFVAATPEWR